MREGDTRKLLMQLNKIKRMSREYLQDAVTMLPRTTFIEFFRALDPLHVARDCDPAGTSHISVGMFKMLHMESSIDDWGVRKLYTRLLQRLLMLMDALKSSGHALNVEEYISLLRCAGAASDIMGVKKIWRDLILGPAVVWRNSEVYTEFIKARFLTDPLYTNYQKTTRMVTPRNLHRSRMRLAEGYVRRLDTLHLMLRGKKLRFGLNKDAELVEEQMRLLRGNGPALRLFNRVIVYGILVDENLLCAIMIALGRSGTLHFIGTHILQKQFGIIMSHLTLDERDSQSQAAAQGNTISSGPFRIRPTVRLMRAVVETYGSNGEISIAVQLVEHLSNAYGIPIPPDVWQDLLEWTYIMSTPPATTAWKIAGLYSKIPSPKAVEMIWNAMTSPPYNQVPSFEHYDVLIRSLIGQRSYNQAEALPRMREAVALYHEQCQEYEAAVFEYIQNLRDGISSGATVHRFECARFKKQQMWYDISVWCRTLLKNLRYSLVSPVPNPLVPDFIQEFRPFLKNPVRYPTPTGRVSLVDPVIETFTSMQTGVIEQTLRMKDKKGKWAHLRRHQRKVAVLSSHSLANFNAAKLTDPLSLLAPQQDAFQPVHQRQMPS
ncbi:hypothetical protein HD806DRAFT_524738 [Xylariaceae sp. AK1471]|nr:hypothetical protein HD806DRAFT_524738 [Xylariaceae sp. AK1471]